MLTRRHCRLGDRSMPMGRSCDEDRLHPLLLRQQLIRIGIGRGISDAPPGTSQSRLIHIADRHDGGSQLLQFCGDRSTLTAHADDGDRIPLRCARRHRFEAG